MKKGGGGAFLNSNQMVFKNQVFFPSPKTEINNLLQRTNRPKT